MIVSNEREYAELFFWSIPFVRIDRSWQLKTLKHNILKYIKGFKGNGNDKNNADMMLRALVCTKQRPQNGSHAGYKTNPKSQ
jgi:hypothetical protein